jgi:hypothetical protein
MVEVAAVHTINQAHLLQVLMVALVAVAQTMQQPVEQQLLQVKVITVDKAEQG